MVTRREKLLEELPEVDQNQGSDTRRPEKAWKRQSGKHSIHVLISNTPRCRRKSFYIDAIARLQTSCARDAPGPSRLPLGWFVCLSDLRGEGVVRGGSGVMARGREGVKLVLGNPTQQLRLNMKSRGALAGLRLLLLLEDTQRPGLGQSSLGNTQEARS